MKIFLNADEYEIKQAWGEWIEGLAEWRIFVTLTMRDRLRGDGEKYSPGILAARRMWAHYSQWLRKFTSDVEWVTVYELQRGREVFHTHSLVGGPFERGIEKAIAESRKVAWDMWGFNRIEEYKKGVGATGYLGRYLVKAGGDVDYSPGLGRKC